MASASTIMMATSSVPSALVTIRPATAMSNTAFSSWEYLGKQTHWPSISAMRTPPMGPLKGAPESVVDAEAALIAKVL